MRSTVDFFVPFLCAAALSLAVAASAEERPARYETRKIDGWTVQVDRRLWEQDTAATTKALELLQTQLAEIVRVVPAAAVAKLREVTLWISPEYPGIGPTAEYHPDVGWLREHGRNPTMARAVEFTNVRIFERETQRMPVFVLHELAHAYHDRVLGHDHARIHAAFRRAVDSHSYDAVSRWRGPGQPLTTERAYAIGNEKEYFAETTEAFFGRNDFFPFTREELRRHDPEMAQLLAEVWGVPAGAAAE